MVRKADLHHSPGPGDGACTKEVVKNNYRCQKMQKWSAGQKWQCWDLHKRHRNNLLNTEGCYCLLLWSVFKKHCYHIFRLFFATTMTITFLSRHSWHHRIQGNIQFSRFLIKLLVLRKSKWRTCWTVTFLRWDNDDFCYYPSCSIQRRKPVSVLSAVSVFQGSEGQQRIAVLGSFSTGEHNWVLPIHMCQACSQYVFLSHSHVHCAQLLALLLDVRPFVSYGIALCTYSQWAGFWSCQAVSPTVTTLNSSGVNPVKPSLCPAQGH